MGAQLREQTPHGMEDSLSSAARQIRQSPLHKPQPQKVMIVSAAHDYHCKYQKGDYLNLLSAINKQVSQQFLLIAQALPGTIESER